jgi:hypothetical protein
MRMQFARVLIIAVAVYGAAAYSQNLPAQAWLARIPPLPTTAPKAYAQWIDTGSVLKPGPEFEKVREGIKTQSLMLSRPTQPAAGGTGNLSRKDQALVEKISVFPDTARLLRDIQAARTAQAAISQQWQAELRSLEQSRIRERGALPACHNEAGAPSQAAIRDVELAYAQRKIDIAGRYLEKSQPVVQQLLAAVSPRIEHGDAVMDAWNRLNSPGARAQLAPVAHSAESDALLDVGLVEDLVQEASKQAAKAIADQNAIGRVYAQAKGC